VIPQIIKQIREGNIIKLGNLKPKRDFIFISDVVDALYLLLLRNKNHEIYNLGTGKEHSIRDLMQYFRDLFKNKRKIKIKIEKTRFRKIDRLYLRANINKIKQELHWRPRINIKEGLKILLKKEGLL
jgi:UDP-glucose 4-epimerase